MKNTLRVAAFLTATLCFATPCLRLGAQEANTRFYGQYCAVTTFSDLVHKSHTLICHGDSSPRQGVLTSVSSIFHRKPYILSMCHRQRSDNSKFIAVNLCISNKITYSNRYIEVGYSFDDGEQFFEEWEFSDKDNHFQSNGALTSDMVLVSRFLEQMRKAKETLTYAMYFQTERIPIDYGASNAVDDFLTRCSDFF